MQDFLALPDEIVKSMVKSLSAPRFGRYLATCGDVERDALVLYQWNALVSQSLYVYIQCWEVCLRNKLNEFLTWKYNEAWPYDDARAVRNLKGDDQRRLREAKERQERERDIPTAPTSVVVADLSAGFWVSLLSTKYDVPYVWRYNLARIFPHEKGLTRDVAWDRCDAALTLRNRIAHHEPIYHLDLLDYHEKLQKSVAAMCEGTSAFAEASCTFKQVIKARPQ